MTATDRVAAISRVKKIAGLSATNSSTTTGASSSPITVILKMIFDR
jgi:hypothetical protein